MPLFGDITVLLYCCTSQFTWTVNCFQGFLPVADSHYFQARFTSHVPRFREFSTLRMCTFQTHQVRPAPVPANARMVARRTCNKHARTHVHESNGASVAACDTRRHERQTQAAPWVTSTHATGRPARGISLRAGHRIHGLPCTSSERKAAGAAKGEAAACTIELAAPSCATPSVMPSRMPSSPYCSPRRRPASVTFRGVSHDAYGGHVRLPWIHADSC